MLSTLFQHGHLQMDIQKLKSQFVCLGVGKPENNNQFSVLILFPERVFDIIQPDPNRTLPARLLGPGKFGASFDFQLKPLQVLAQTIFL